MLKNYEDNKCDKCNQRIHPNFIGYHKCGHANCSICKNAITNSEYWDHIRSHPGHENDNPPPPRTNFGNRNISSNSGSAAGAIQLKVGNEYVVDITEISRQQGDGIARIQGICDICQGWKNRTASQDHDYRNKK
jgi:hypothetical protein